MIVAIFKIEEDGTGAIEIYAYDYRGSERKADEFDVFVENDDWRGLVDYIRENATKVLEIKPDFSINEGAISG